MIMSNIAQSKAMRHAESHNLKYVDIHFNMKKAIQKVTTSYDKNIEPTQQEFKTIINIINSASRKTLILP